MALSTCVYCGAAMMAESKGCPGCGMEGQRKTDGLSLAFSVIGLALYAPLFFAVRAVSGFF